MKKLLSFIFFAFFLLLFPGFASAHLLGQQSFFTVNGIYTGLYAVPSTSLPDFVLPQDSAPKSYLIGEPIAFAIDTTKLPMMSNETLAKTTFLWKFGDGETFEGLSTTHAYTKMGSYILEIYADDGSGVPPILLQSLLVNIIPDSSYVLPKAVIQVNKTVSKDPLADPLSFSFSAPFSFDAKRSKIPAGIASVQWDFGDIHSASGVTVSHQYKDDLRIVFPLLRIKDHDGFIADTFVQINNTDYDTPIKPKKTKKNGLFSLPIGMIGVMMIIGVGIWVWKARFRGRS